MPSLTTGRSPWRRRKRGATATTARRRRTPTSLRALWRRIVPRTSTTTTTTAPRVRTRKPGLLSRAFRVLSCGGGRRSRAARRW
uniref:Uncharacterized protein n=1 Tax=Oryza glumipatula TaxID=40148 RepID=A0A0E0BG26_9ORYZ